ncbi:MAG TPA: YeeE/YedE family protein [Saprospiraceae bacterium]|nr:YeeE/YedE family protein [Saprospiraceae bacterium]MCB9271756.1 YeeE/YedE family protein [Lewinellaceae bacterium]HPG07875.1 YeeE/YedE family protein [Saprospiraceae bacterium]HPR00157.1 YeeE/YedE family protein [Saprospiraceae bacterium]HQU54749.1 YeeE/YedE family protein [Saprospiraceae bacterium]
MRLLSFFLVGILFGIVATKSEVISWFRIHEMFRFESFHMYGVIGSAVVFGIITMLIMKKLPVKTIDGKLVVYKVKAMQVKRFLIGGSIFGMGWGLIGACPGPMFTMLGHGFLIFGVVIVSAVVGAFVYGAIRDYLPH